MASNVLQISGLSFKYAEQSPEILKSIELEFTPGFHGIIGPNGSGKSTLLKILANQLSGYTGIISYEGNSLEQIPTREKAQLISYLPQQNSAEFAYKVHEIVLMGRMPHLSRFSNGGDKDLEIVNESIKSVDLWDKRERSILELSGGEQQRVFIAKTLAQTTPIILLDEALASLDYQHQLSLLTLLCKKSKENQCTILLSIHDINLASMFCDTLTVLKEGSLMSQGKPEEIINVEMLKETFKIETQVHHINDRPMFFPKA